MIALPSTVKGVMKREPFEMARLASTVRSGSWYLVAAAKQAAAAHKALHAGSWNLQRLVVCGLEVVR